MNVFLAAPKLEGDIAAGITAAWADRLHESLRDFSGITVVPFLGKDAVRAKVEIALKEDKENKGILDLSIMEKKINFYRRMIKRSSIEKTSAF
ncbi:MAG: hypothetical protein GY757_45245 [bacterium]|nr:hypothetical protein [bacterium]